MHTAITIATPRSDAPTRLSVTWSLRVLGAALLVASALIHLHLYRSGYSGIPTIGRLFLLNVVSGFALATAVLLIPARLLLSRLAAAGAAIFEAGTLAALIVTVTHGLFGFQDTSSAPYFNTTVVVETLGVLVLGALFLLPRQSG